jgi:hypothetical protein
MQEETCGVVEFLYKCNCENVEHWCSQTRKLTENLAQGNLCWIVATYKAGTETTAPIERLGQKMQANRKRREESPRARAGVVVAAEASCHCKSHVLPV